jgi:hypothetical protein
LDFNNQLMRKALRFIFLFINFDPSGKYPIMSFENLSDIPFRFDKTSNTAFVPQMPESSEASWSSGSFSGIDFSNDFLELDQDILSLIQSPSKAPISSSWEGEMVTFEHDNQEGNEFVPSVVDFKIDGGSFSSYETLHVSKEASHPKVDLEFLVGLGLREYKQAVSYLPLDLQDEAKKLRRRKQNYRAHKRLNERKRKQDQLVKDELRCTQAQLEKVLDVVSSATHAHFAHLLDESTRIAFLAAVKANLK